MIDQSEVSFVFVALPHSTFCPANTRRCLGLRARSQQHLVSGGAGGGAGGGVDVSTASDAGCQYSISVTWGSTVRRCGQD